MSTLYDKLVLYCVCIIPIMCYIVFYVSRRRLYELAELIPGIPGLPLIGNTLEFSFITNPLDITKRVRNLDKLAPKNEGVLKFWFGPILYIGLVNPPDVQIVLNKELRKDSTYRFLKPWLGEGLITGDLTTWKPHRRMLMPTFHQKILDNFIEIFVEKSEIMIKKMSKTTGTFNAVDFLKPCTLDIICETAMGVNINAQESMDLPYIQATMGFMEVMNRRLFKWWLHSNWIYKWTKYAKKERAYLKTLRDFTNRVIQEKKKNIQKNEENYLYNEEVSSKRMTFLDLIMKLSDNDHQWTDKEFQEEVDTMTAAGTDTTSQTTSYVLVMIGSHPGVQDKVFEELFDIFGDSYRPVMKEDLFKMNYLDRVIKETLRLFPPGPMVVRRLENEVKIEKYTLPAGSGCIIPIYAIHRDPKIWGEKVEEFDPDNFLPEKCAERHPCAFIPFSVGPRNCIGKQFALMSMKVMLANILRSYKVHSSVDHKELWNNGVCFEIFTTSLGGFPISIEPRYK